MLAPRSPDTEVTPAVVAAAVRVMSDIDDVAARVFAVLEAWEPRMALLPNRARTDMRRYQRQLALEGLKSLASGRSLDELGPRIAATAKLRQTQGITLTQQVTASYAAIQVVTEALVGSLGPDPDAVDIACVHTRMLEFLRVMSVYSAAGRESDRAVGADRGAALRALFARLLAADAPTGPADDLPVRAAGLGVMLPLRHVLVLPGDTDAEALTRRAPAAVVSGHEGRVVVLSAEPVRLSQGPRGRAFVDGPGWGAGAPITAAVTAALGAYDVAVAIGRDSCAAEQVGTLSAVLAMPPARRAAAIRSCLADLPESDRGRELLVTVSALLTHGQAAAAARALHLHRHTLEYRLRRFGELTGQDLADPVVRLRCQHALLLLNLWPHR